MDNVRRDPFPIMGQWHMKIMITANYLLIIAHVIFINVMPIKLSKLSNKFLRKDNLHIAAD